VLAFLHDHVLDVCGDILQIASGNFTKFTTSVQLRTMMMDFEIERSKVKVRARKKSLSQNVEDRVPAAEILNLNLLVPVVYNRKLKSKHC